MDRFRNLKFIGYCRAFLPPEESGPISMEDFIGHCKFQLCLATQTLMKDPIWETYEDEDILAEYYAHVFTKDEKAKDEFLVSLKGADSDIYDWFDEMIAKNQEELKQASEELPEEVGFDPNEVM